MYIGGTDILQHLDSIGMGGMCFVIVGTCLHVKRINNCHITITIEQMLMGI